MGKRDLVALLNLSSRCLMMVERLFLAVPKSCLQFVIVVFPDHTHLLFSNDSNESNIPAEWQVAFDSMCNDILPVKTTNNFSIKVAPGEVKTLSGYVRNTKAFQTAVTKPMDTSLSTGLTICPRVVSLGLSSSTTHIPVLVCTLVIEIPPWSLFSSTNCVDVVDPWTPDYLLKKQKPKVTNSEDLGVKVETDNLTQDQVRKA